jgi:hypothetical protein
MKMTVLRDVPPYSRFRGALLLEAASTSETSVTFYQATQRNIPEDSHHLIKMICHTNISF